MPWTLILNWRVIFAIVGIITLAATHWKFYALGKLSVINQVRIEAAANEKAARTREQALVAAKHKAEEAYEAQKLINRRAVAGAQSELGRLRDTLNARSTSPTATACTGVDAAPATERQLLGQCAQALTDVAAEADRHAATVSGLQSYIKAVHE